MKGQNHGPVRIIPIMSMIVYIKVDIDINNGVVKLVYEVDIDINNQYWYIQLNYKLSSSFYWGLPFGNHSWQKNWQANMSELGVLRCMFFAGETHGAFHGGSRGREWFVCWELVGGDWLPSIFYFPIHIGFRSSSQLTKSYIFQVP